MHHYANHCGVKRFIVKWRKQSKWCKRRIPVLQSTAVSVSVSKLVSTRPLLLSPPFSTASRIKLHPLFCILSLLISYPTTYKSPLLTLFFIQTTDTFLLLSQLSFSKQLTILSLNFPSTLLPSNLNCASAGDCSREQWLSDYRNASPLSERLLFNTFIALDNGDLPESLLFWFLYHSLLFLLILLS